MPTHEFYARFFHGPVHGVYQSEKRISSVWDPAQSVFQNKRPKGLAFFYEKPMGHGVEVQFELYSPGSKAADNFVRLAFLREVGSEKELREAAFRALRKPVEKALQKDYNTDDFLLLCHQRDFLKLTSVKSEPVSEQLYPMVGAAVVRVEAEADS